MGCGLPGPSHGFLHVQRKRPGDQQHVSMAGARDEPDAETFDVVVGIVQRMDFEFASVAGARIDLPDAEGAAQYIENLLLQLLMFSPPSVAGDRGRLCGDIGQRNAF